MLEEKEKKEKEKQGTNTAILRLLYTPDD